VGELVLVGAVEADPGDAGAATAGGVEFREAVGRGRALPVAIEGAIDDHGDQDMLV
jgi:hypothetical protein